jgi:predicted lipid carrier protein YhbT
VNAVPSLIEIKLQFRALRGMYVASPLHVNYWQMSSPTSIPVLPTVVGIGLRPLPLAPITLATDLMVRSIARRHGTIFARLGTHAGKTFLIEPTDLPFIFVVVPKSDSPSVTVLRSRAEISADARIAGPIAALIGLLHGAYDGDALFFSRDLVIEGDMEAVLALRNALDDAEIDLVTEAAAALGPFASPAEQIGRLAAVAIERLTGVAVTRPKAGQS